MGLLAYSGTDMLLCSHDASFFLPRVLLRTESTQSREKGGPRTSDLKKAAYGSAALMCGLRCRSHRSAPGFHAPLSSSGGSSGGSSSHRTATPLAVHREPLTWSREGCVPPWKPAPQAQILNLCVRMSLLLPPAITYTVVLLGGVFHIHCFISDTLKQHYVGILCDPVPLPPPPSFSG